MKELKFRVWIERYKKYMPVSLIDFEPISGKIVSIEVVATGGDWAKFYPEEVILEQYTGLKDKNGKEIYEGDIVQIDDHILGDFEVLWHNLGWTIRRSVGFETLSVHKSEDIVVIGNIHENHDLLGDTNVTNKGEE